MKRMMRGLKGTAVLAVMLVAGSALAQDSQPQVEAAKAADVQAAVQAQAAAVQARAQARSEARQARAEADAARVQAESGQRQAERLARSAQLQKMKLQMAPIRLEMAQKLELQMAPIRLEMAPMEARLDMRLAPMRAEMMARSAEMEGMSAAMQAHMMARVAVMQAGMVSVGDPQVKDDLFDGTEKFAKGASDVTSVNLGPDMLGMVSGRHGGDMAHKLNFMVVRSYEYPRPGMYNLADVDAYRQKLKSGNWNCFVHTYESKSGESTDICNRPLPNGEGNEMVIMTVEPKELTFIHMSGKGSLADLGRMGRMGGYGGDYSTPPTPPTPPTGPTEPAPPAPHE